MKFLRIIQRERDAGELEGTDPTVVRILELFAEESDSKFDEVAEVIEADRAENKARSAATNRITVGVATALFVAIVVDLLARNPPG